MIIIKLLKNIKFQNQKKIKWKKKKKIEKMKIKVIKENFQLKLKIYKIN